MSKFYAYVGQYGNQLLVRSYQNGQQSIFKTGFCPSLFVPSKKKNTEWSSIYEQPLDEVKFSDINDAKEFIKNYFGVSNLEIHGMQNFQYQYINQTYHGDIDYSLADMNIKTLDIETAVDGISFPDVETANMEITLITLFDKNTKVATTFSSRPWNDADKEGIEDVTVNYIQSKDEYSMLKCFVGFWSANYPTIVTGWNTSKFDFPYICNRIARILDEDHVKKLSPFGIVMQREVEIFAKKVKLFDIVGIIEADYLDLYKKYTFTPRESYSLEFIAQAELGCGKLEYEGSFKSFYENQWDTFVKYNIIDCLRVDQLDDKMQLLDLLMSITYMVKCNAKDTFGTVKPWDIFIFNHLADKKIAVPPNGKKNGGEFEGAWVKEPQLGMHGWTLSFDFSSLYPTIMRQWNISPEMFVRNYRETINVKDILNATGHNQWAVENECTVAANGTFYKKHRMGFLPEILAHTMAKRKIAKTEMLKLEQEYQTTKNKALVPRISALNNIQMAAKILNNSVYGAVSNAGFRYFELAMAEAITLTGQASDMHIEKSINAFLNKVMETKNVDYVIAGDTDSVYVNIDPIVQKFYPGKSTAETTAWLDKFCQKAIQPILDKSTGHIFELCNCFDKLMDMKREAIASKALWQKKKRYGMIVHNSEGVSYDPPKLKVMGLEIVRSSTPKVIRDELKQCLAIMFADGEQALQQHISEAKVKWLKLNPEEIAFPRGVSDVEKYSTPSGYTKGCPIQVRAAVIYNQNREKGSASIRSGDKIKFVYLKEPNPLKEDIVGFPVDGKMPLGKSLVKYIDFDKMWEKSFLTPLSGLTDACGWHHTKQSTLDDFFG